MQYPTFSLEYELLQRHSIIAGVDEVGRGCLAGPVVAGIAIITDDSSYISGIRDSKTLSEKQREKLAQKLTEVLPAYSIGVASAKEIDQIGIRKATHLAMLRAYWKLELIPQALLMDGEKATIPIFSKTYQYDKGDLRFYSIAAASILAKVYRDSYMRQLEEQMPGYSFDKHKGYGTKLHYESLFRLGLSDVHRRTFIH
ncbi:ribonuclease HII [bacterium]|nr:ribonuclease HII [bacterium]